MATDCMPMVRVSIQLSNKNVLFKISSIYSLKFIIHNYIGRALVSLLDDVPFTVSSLVVLLESCLSCSGAT